MSSVTVVHVVYVLDGLVEELSRALPDVTFKSLKYDLQVTSTEDLPSRLEGAEIVICDPRVLGPSVQRLPASVKWIQSLFAGTDRLSCNIDQSKPLPDVLLTRIGEGFGPDISTYVIGQIIARERKFFQYYRNQMERRYEKFLHENGGCRNLCDLTVGILGVGNIGQHVAKVCKSFDMRVLGLVKRDVPVCERSSCVDQYFFTGQIRDLVKECDYICNVLPSCPSTRNLLSGDVLSSCKPRAALINVGRSDVIDQECLLDALRKEWIDHAILDVFDTYTLPEDSVLWDNPKITITPHVAGILVPWTKVVKIFSENLSRYREGKQLKFRVDLTAEY